ncbi:MAG: SUMF1/EgtB/PvdO family nonheme iron enzyme [Akkermansiaceae bacterium]|nr:SUMF1/EgtB/PvdO family nonheme iron enzyme [Akkermansiaceae bacterium]
MARRAPRFCGALLGLLGFAAAADPGGPPAKKWDPADLGATPTPAAWPLPNPDRLAVTRRVHAVIAAAEAGPDREAAMKPYDLRVGRVRAAALKMAVIPGGEFEMGSDREDEAPPRRVRLAPFWMSATEIPWGFYLPFLYNGHPRGSDGTMDLPEPGSALVDVISQPTQPYRHFLLAGFASGNDLPAMNMTHHAASKFCQWLSAQSGHFYRLPTEAEWEYACRAGTNAAYHFGDDPAQLGDFAWFEGNSGNTYQPCGGKKPNRWGLHDMHGNVAEWVLDGRDDGYRRSIPRGAFNPWRIPEHRYPRVLKGGSWEDPPPALRSAARHASSNRLKALDPSFPKSIWTHTSAQHIGFRIVRPLATPGLEGMHLFWNTDWWEAARNVEDL